MFERLDIMTSQRYTAAMSQARRATIYFDPAVHQALRVMAAATDRTISEIVNDAVRRVLSEDGADPELLRSISSFERGARERP
jgi:predicted transcriptional regulator